jgi:hypothetical protein
MQVTIAKPFWATPVSSEYLKDLMYSSFASRASLNESCGKELTDISTPPRLFPGPPVRIEVTSCASQVH